MRILAPPCTKRAVNSACHIDTEGKCDPILFYKLCHCVSLYNIRSSIHADYSSCVVSFSNKTTKETAQIESVGSGKKYRSERSVCIVKIFTVDEESIGTLRLLAIPL